MAVDIIARALAAAGGQGGKGATPQDLTSTALVTLNGDDWNIIKNVRLGVQDAEISGLDPEYTLVKVKININGADHYAVLLQNSPTNYTGELNIVEDNKLYEVGLIFNGDDKLIFKVNTYEYMLDDALYDNSGVPLFDREDYVLQTLEGVDLITGADGHVLFDTNDSLLTASLEGGDNV